MKFQKVTFLEFKREYFEAGLELAKDMVIKSGMELEGHPFWDRMEKEAGFKEAFFLQIKEKYDYTVDSIKEIEAKLPKGTKRDTINSALANIKTKPEYSEFKKKVK